MKLFLLLTLFKLISFLPLSMLRALGGMVGIIALKLSKRAGKRLRANLLVTGVCTKENIDKFVHATAKELGKTLLETVAIAWQKPANLIAQLVTQGANFDQVVAAAKTGAVVLITPHIGNFEIGIKATAAIIQDKPFSILYKPSKDSVFNAIMLKGRTADNINPVPTTRRGIVSLLRTLKSGGILGILPDSVASSGDGVWVDFFGQRVFATTLAAKLTLLPGVSTFFVSALRVKDGFVIDYLPYAPATEDVALIVQDIYRMLETVVLSAPTQYYWSYDRFRTPSHALATTTKVMTNSKEQSISK